MGATMLHLNSANRNLLMNEKFFLKSQDHPVFLKPYGIGNPAGIGKGAGLWPGGRDREGSGLGDSRLRTRKTTNNNKLSSISAHSYHRLNTVRRHKFNHLAINSTIAVAGT